MFHLCLFVSLFIYQLDYANGTKPICTKLGGGMGHGPGISTFSFSMVPIKGSEQEILYFLCHCERHFCQYLAMVEVCSLLIVILVTHIIIAYLSCNGLNLGFALLLHYILPKNSLESTSFHFTLRETSFAAVFEIQYISKAVLHIYV